MRSGKSSRREFLRATAGGVAVSWSGLWILAGRAVLAGPKNGIKAHIPQSVFAYGALLDRPPNLPSSERREMVRAIAKTYKFNTVRLYPSWAYQNPAPNRFD